MSKLTEEEIYEIKRTKALKQQVEDFISLTFQQWQQLGLSGRVAIEMVWDNGRLKFVRNNAGEQWGDNGTEPQIEE